MESVFDLNDYKDILRGLLPTQGEGRGKRSQLAQFLNCQLSYISLVLSSSKTHFSLEHGHKACEFFSMSEDERDFFILLLSKARAGSTELEGYYEQKIQAFRKERNEIKHRIKNQSTLNQEQRSLYYSDWYYCAIHMLLRCRGDISVSEVAQIFGLSIKKVHECIEFLENAGIIVRGKKGFAVQDVRIHLEANSTWINAHHKNWRNRAILALDSVKEKDLHYSLITSISEPVASKIREKILKMIEENEPLISSAKDEVVYSLNLDFFKLT